MKNQLNKKVPYIQEWEEEKIRFDPDSSPQAWDIYEKIYKKNKLDLNFKEIGFWGWTNYSTPWSDSDKEHIYVNAPNVLFNRLMAPIDKVIDKRKDGETGLVYKKVNRRFGGETDFNFGKNVNPTRCKYTIFRRLLEESYPNGQFEEHLNQLRNCCKKHHAPINFSLMFVMGNLQGYKGSLQYDRIDRFLSKLERFWCGSNQEKGELRTLFKGRKNGQVLVEFLDGFENIEDYCKQIYHITNEDNLIDELIENGKNYIECGQDVVRYMDLAQAFWNEKQKNILNLS